MSMSMVLAGKVEDQKANFVQDEEQLSTFMTTTCDQIASSTDNEEHIIKVNEIMKHLAAERARYGEIIKIADNLEKFSKRPLAERNVAVEEAIRKLECNNFGDDAAKDAHKLQDEYKEFVANHMSKAPSISEGMDMDDDLALAGGNSSGEASRDPFSRAMLMKDDSGKYPIKMPCGHIYNWNTIMSKRQGVWGLKTCAVPGCPKNKFPEDRSGFKEDAKTKNMIQRRDKGIGASQSQAMQSQAVDIDDL